MPEGNEGWEGQAVPLIGESEIKANTIGNDILTITGASGHTADFLVCQTYAGSEKLTVDIDGNVVCANVSGAIVAASSFLQTKHNGTVEPTTAHLTANGGIMLATVSGTPRIYVRMSGTVYKVAVS